MSSWSGGNDWLRLENIVEMTDVVVTLMLSLTLGAPCSSHISPDRCCSPRPPGASIQLPHLILPSSARQAAGGAGAHLVTTRDRLIREPGADKTNPAEETCQQN